MSGDSVDIGKVVSIRYTLRDHTTGDVIEERSSEPYSYVHGDKRVIFGLQQGIHKHRVGEQLTLVVPSELAYASSGEPLMFTHAALGADAESLTIGELVEIREVDLRVVARDADYVYFVEETPSRPWGKTLRYEPVEIVDVRDANREELANASLFFPNDLFNHIKMPGALGDLIASVRHVSMFPPYPWGQRTYARVFESRCSTLEGEIIELGVGRGGMSIFLAKLAAPFGKRVYSLDSFEGLPVPDHERDNPHFISRDYAPNAALGDLLTRFRQELDSFGVSESVVPIKGFFKETAEPSVRDRRFCFAHLDSDLYDSVRVSLEAVWDHAVDGGVIVIDDYFHQAMGPKRAATDFFNARSKSPIYHVSFPYSVFVIKGEEGGQASRSIDGNHYSFDWLRSDEYFVDAVRASAERCARADPTSPATENARLLLGILERSDHRASDIYVYWKALEEFWDRIGGMFIAKKNRPIRI